MSLFLAAEPEVTSIPGVADYRSDSLGQQHVHGPVSYPHSPPVGGDHHPVWQNCNGAVYEAPIVNEHAVHSLEHGAVWITYSPDLTAEAVEALAGRVHGVDYMLMSPYPGLDRPISLQAWGYQLKVEDPADPRIDQFIAAARIKLAPEPGATCDGGTG